MTQSRSTLQRCGLQVTAMVLTACMLAGCTTRQVTDSLEGSTAQRLVTLSLDQFIEALAAQSEITALKDKTIHLRVNFLADHPLVAYATRLLNVRLRLIHDVTIIATTEPADYEVDVFFSSIGTDSDEFGLSVPTLGLASSDDGTIDILALDMFHGITEGYALVTNTNTGVIKETERLLARIRRDNVSTPVINFPLNQVD